MELILALLLNNLAPGAIPAEKLAPAIIKAANKFEVDPVLLTRIVLVESKGLEKAQNEITQDYGIAQLNINTMNAMGITKKCALEYKCNLMWAAKILSQFKRVCSYNVGTGSLIGTRLKNCLRYEQRLAKIN